MNRIIAAFIQGYNKGNKQVTATKEETKAVSNPMFFVSRGIVEGVSDDGYRGILCSLTALKDGWYYKKEDKGIEGPFSCEADCKVKLFSYWARL